MVSAQYEVIKLIQNETLYCLSVEARGRGSQAGPEGLTQCGVKARADHPLRRRPRGQARETAAQTSRRRGVAAVQMTGEATRAQGPGVRQKEGQIGHQ